MANGVRLGPVTMGKGPPGGNQQQQQVVVDEIIVHLTPIHQQV